MKRDWSADELVAQWILLPTELALLGNKSGATRLGFAVLLKFFQGEGCFPRHSQEIPGAAVEYVARQIGVPAAEWVHYNWDSRGAKYHRTQIRDLLGFHEATVEDGEALVVWLDEHVLQQDRQMDRLKASVIERCRVLRIEPPTPDRIDRLIRSAVHRHEERFSKTVLARLSADTQAQLNDLVIPGEPLFEPVEQEAGRTLLQELRADPGRASLEKRAHRNCQLERIRGLRLPSDLFASLSPKVLQGYQQRASAEEPYELRRHPPPLRAMLPAAYCHLGVTRSLITWWTC